MQGARLISLLVAVLWPGSAAHADIVTVVPSATAEAAETGGPVYFTNEGGESARFSPPTRLSIEVVKNGRPERLELELAEEARTLDIAAGAFHKAMYRAETGDETEKENEEFVGQAAPPPQSAGPALTGYRPIYALFGTGPFNAKLQLSVKYRPLTAGNWLDGFHLGYTQLIFWDLDRPSSPFRDVTFSPELMYIWGSRAPPQPKRPSASVQVGIRHDSNGKSGADSRTLNTAYVEPSLAIRLAPDWVLTAAPRAWLFYGKREGPDIASYRGHTGLRLSVAHAGGLALSSEVRGNLWRGRGSAQFDMSYPLARVISSRLGLSLYGQLFTGYGETLLDYDRQSTRLRFGLAIIP